MYVSDACSQVQRTHPQRRVYMEQARQAGALASYCERVCLQDSLVFMQRPSRCNVAGCASRHSPGQRSAATWGMGGISASNAAMLVGGVAPYASTRGLPPPAAEHAHIHQHPRSPLTMHSLHAPSTHMCQGVRPTGGRRCKPWEERPPAAAGAPGARTALLPTGQQLPPPVPWQLHRRTVPAIAKQYSSRS